MYRARRTLAGVLVAGVALAGCGSADDGGGPTSSAPQPGAGQVVQDDVHNAQDVAFAEVMIAHHRQGIELAKLAPGRTSDAKVLAIAKQIADEQTPELAEMTVWMTEWGKPLPAPGAAVTGITGIAPATEVAKLRAAKDAAFDRLFLTLMIAHHEGGVSQSRDEQRTGADERARGLAEDMAGSEEERLAELKKLVQPAG
jgi:uncharacterized protein (DUF305 family)